MEVRVLWNSDLTYLSTKHEHLGDPKWLAFVIRNFGQSVVTEALRRVDGGPDITRGYFWGVCKRVSQEAK